MRMMTMRERLLAVMRGQAIDRVPFATYDQLVGANELLWEPLGRENVGIIRWSGVHASAAPNCRFDQEELVEGEHSGIRVMLHTPEGELTREAWREPVFHSMATARHFIQEPEDYHILRAYLRDIIITEDLDRYLTDVQAVGEDGLAMVTANRTPYQQLWVEWVNLENLAWHLVECPELVEECITLMADIERRIFGVIRDACAKVPIDYVNIPDNITAPTIGETYFRRYCLPLYNELGDMLAGTGALFAVHMDGDLKPLWQAIAESPVQGLDSFSPAPDNDTSVAQARAQWPDMRLFVNFPSSVHLADPTEVYAQARQILDEGGHSGQLWIQISENVPPNRWQHSFPAILQAIADFGKP